MGMEQWWNYTDGKTEVLGGKPLTVPLFPAQISRRVALIGARVSVMRGHRLAAWAMARLKAENNPYFIYTYLIIYSVRIAR